MSTLAITLTALVLAITVLQLTCASLFLHAMLRRPPVRIADAELPKLAVLMGVKGVDPDMPIGLQRLMQQDYPDYELRIVIDGPEDPAWGAVQAAIHNTQAQHVTVENFESDPRDGTVNSTNAKIMQSLRKLDDSVEAVAMADGDLVPHADWLRELVSPLVHDPHVGATFGNRWFVPEDGYLGSLARHLWNVPTVICMYLLKMPWGGCFAIRSDVIERCGLREKWPRVMAFDAATLGELRRHDLRLQFVPSLMMANREECGLAFCANFIQRQMLWTRLYHPDWWLAAVFGMVATSIPLYTLLIAVWSLALSKVSQAIVLFGAVAFLVLLPWLLLPLIEWAVRRRMHERRELARFTFGRWLRCALALPIAHAVQAFAFLRATFTRRVQWRGVVLEVHGRNDIRMVKNEPAVTNHGGSLIRESL